MLSLSNTYSKDELLEYDQRTRKLLDGVPIEYLIEPKIDGVAISLRYEKGRLAYALTRGMARLEMSYREYTHDSLTLRLQQSRRICWKSAAKFISIRPALRP